MAEQLYKALTNYYNTLELTGYLPDSYGQELLIVGFYRDFVFEDYRGILSEEDYGLIQKALNCLYGKTCLMPYPDYLKMGNVQLGGITELATRVKNLENTTVVKPFDSVATDDSDVIILTEEE